eukprot:5874508-Amphidinium_carterae.1
MFGVTFEELPNFDSLLSIVELFVSGNVDSPGDQVHRGVGLPVPSSQLQVGDAHSSSTLSSGYYGTYYYYYGWYSQPAQCTNSMTHFASTWDKCRMASYLALWTLATLTLSWLAMRWNYGILLAVHLCLRGWCQKIRTDSARLVRVAKFAASEILMVLMTYCCCSCTRRRLRKWALAMRPFVVQTQDDGEEVGSISPEALRTPRSTSRRSLADIQLQIAGGSAHPARRTMRQRYPSHRRRCVIIRYNPLAAGDCMFAAIARATKQAYGVSLSVKSLRRLTYDLLMR